MAYLGLNGDCMRVEWRMSQPIAIWAMIFQDSGKIGTEGTVDPSSTHVISM